MIGYRNIARAMFLRALPGGLLAASLFGFASAQAPISQYPDTPPLNSEKIVAKFGSYGVEVVRQNDDVRVSSLYSGSGKSRTTRTLAIVLFAKDMPESLRAAHDAVTDGASIGSTFREAGWRINKTNIYLGEIRAARNTTLIDRWLAHAGNAIFAIHIYEFEVAKDGHQYRYATIAEIHDPAFVTLADLKIQYPGEGESTQSLNSRSANALRQVFTELNR